MNRTLEQMLSAHVNDHHTDWDLYLQRSLLAYRSSVHSSTRETPARLMLGRELHLPVDLMYQFPEPERTTVNAYVTKLQETLQTAFAHAREAGAVAQRRQKAMYDKHAKQPKFNVGDMVSKHSPVVAPGTTPKFHRPWKGPYTILEKVDDVVYRIADRSGKMETVHVDRLKRWNGPAPSRIDHSDHTPEVSVPVPIQYTPNIDYDMPAPIVAQPAPVNNPVKPVPVVHHYNLRNRANIHPPQRFAN